MSASIYLITNTVNGKTYVGMTTTSLLNRFSNHKSAARRGSKYAIHRAIRKYGDELFTITLLESVDNRNNLPAREIHWIAKLHPEYNMTKGGETPTNGPLSASHRAAISRAMKGNPKVREWKVGRRASDKTKQKMSDSQKTRQWSQEHKAKLAEHCRQMASKAANARWAKYREEKLRVRQGTSPSAGTHHTNGW